MSASRPLADSSGLTRPAAALATPAGPLPLQVQLAVRAAPRCGACRLFAASYHVLHDPLLLASFRAERANEVPVAEAPNARGRSVLLCEECRLALHYDTGERLLTELGDAIRVFPCLPPGY